MSGFDQKAHGLDNLLELDGETIEVGEGYWVSMRAKRVRGDARRPHGIQYALSLHAPGGRRIMGYDNAHKPTKGGGPSANSVRPLTNDHVHKYGAKTSRPYEFISPGKLLEDFWADVEAVLQEEGVS